MKKRLITVLTSLTIAAALTGCGAKEIDVTTLATTLNGEGQFAEQLTEVSTEVTEKRYDIDDELVEMCAAYKGTSAVADEITVIKTSDVNEVHQKVLDYQQSQIKAYESYLPTEVPKLEDAIVYIYNDTVIYCASEDSEKAQQIIFDYTTN